MAAKKQKWVRAGHDLYHLRTRLNLTQAALADLIGVTTNTVARWERGEIGMKDTTARLIDMLFKEKEK